LLVPMACAIKMPKHQYDLAGLAPERGLVAFQTVKRVG
jgi:hypothetical protein